MQTNDRHQVHHIFIMPNYFSLTKLNSNITLEIDLFITGKEMCVKEGHELLSLVHKTYLHMIPYSLEIEQLKL